jgi:glycosyltransferase involved in cell wall biosynthesis
LLQYIPFLLANGWTIDTQSLYSEKYVTRLYETGKRSVVKFFFGTANRAAFLVAQRLAQYDVIVTQQDVLPWLPFGIERLLCHGYARFVIDMDDAWFEGYGGVRMLRKKYPALLARMAQINVGNRTLAEYAARYSERVNIIPTVVDTERYPPKTDYTAHGRLVVGWIGTPVTARYLSGCAEALKRAATEIPFVLRCVGAHRNYQLPGLEVELVPWDLKSEAEIIRTFDVGIMPLIDEPFAHGKCGYKLIQYMAAGVPALGTAIGANRDIISEGINGLLASSAEEFAEKLVALLRNECLRARIGPVGRQTVEKSFSLRSQQGKFIESLERAARF